MMLLVCGQAIAATTKTMCPNKVLDTGTVEGTFLGWFEAEEDLDSIGIKPDNEDEIYIAASEEDANKFFGNAEGQRVSAQYE